MLADSPSRLKNFIWPHEDDPKERLLLDPIPQEEMNQIMLKPMMKASGGYWLLVAILASIVAICLFGYWFYMMRWMQKVHFSITPRERTVTSGLSCSFSGSGK